VERKHKAMKIKDKQRNNKIDTKILHGSIYDLRPQDKVLRATFCSYSLNDITIQNTLINRRTGIDKYDNQINQIQLPSNLITIKS
jgi:hypothetical protein